MNYTSGFGSRFLETARRALQGVLYTFLKKLHFQYLLKLNPAAQGTRHGRNFELSSFMMKDTVKQVDPLFKNTRQRLLTKEYHGRVAKN